MSSELFVKVDQASVKAALDDGIRVAVSEVLGRDPKAVIQEVVKAALGERGNGNTYGSRGTLFGQAVDKMIREEAEASVKAWIEERRPEIKALLDTRLRDSDDLPTALVDKIVAGLANGFRFSFNVEINEQKHEDY